MADDMLKGLRRFPIRTVIDVGANIGQFAKKAVEAFPEARIYAFEPLPGPFAELSRWADEQGQQRVKAFCLGLGERVETTYMHHHPDHSASSSLLKATDGCLRLCPAAREQERVSVWMNTLDRAMAREVVDDDVLIKVDVQGYEDRVIRGGLKTFGRARVCIMEICLDELYEGQAAFLKLVLMLSKLGFDYAGNTHQELCPDGHVAYVDALFIRGGGRPLLTILGLDGGTWFWIEKHLEHLPTFRALLDVCDFGVLECNVSPIATVPSWPTIFTGLSPQEHGIFNFLEGEEIAAALEKLPWIWKRFARPAVLSIPISRPPICVNAEMANWRDVVWPGLDLGRIFEGHEWLTRKSLEVLKEKPELFIVVLPILDRVSHHYMMNEQIIRDAYVRMDESLSRLRPFFAGGDFLLVSDHGMAPCRKALKFGWKAWPGGIPADQKARLNPEGGCHSPYGVIIGNRGACWKVTEVYDLLLANYLGKGEC